MNQPEFNEREFGLKIRNKLNANAGRLDRGVSERLFVARQRALARHQPSAGNGALNSIGRGLLALGSEYGAVLLLSALLLIGVVGGDYWMGQQRISELEEVDSALLADDLPIAAYLDKGFDAWLRMSDSDSR